MERLQTLIIALVFAGAHLASPWAFRVHERSRHTVGSFSGGLAAAYVFLHLIPEIDAGGELLGPRIYFVTLVGLSLYYGLEILAHRKSEEAGGGRIDAGIHIGSTALYTAMLVFTLAAQLPDRPGLTGFFIATMAVHLITGDVGLQEEFGARYVTRYRFVLFASAWAGFLLSLVRVPHEVYIDIITALLAGMMLFKVFRKELPEFRDARFAAFLAGMLLFLGAHLALE